MISETDPSELPEASYGDDPASHFLSGVCPNCQHEVDAICPHCRTHVEADAEQNRLVRDLRRVFSILEEARNTKFMLGCLMIATGDSFADGISMTDYARKWRVKKATVSKHCRQICKTLGLRPSRYMASEEVVQKHRLSNGRPTQRLL